MGDAWFEIATLDHFWIRRRFEVLRQLAGELMSSAGEMAEIGCGHGLLQREIEDAYGREVTGFDLNEYALRQNISRQSRIYCYDIFAKDGRFRSRYDVIFLFDVLEHITEENAFLEAVRFHLKTGGKLLVNVPAGQWAYSEYDRMVGHVRRYSIDKLRAVAGRSGLGVQTWSYWGLPLVPVLAVRKLWLLMKSGEKQIIAAGMDTRTSGVNGMLWWMARCELIPQRMAGASLMAVLESANC